MTNNNKNEELQIKSHQIAYDIIKSTASWLENPDNEVFGLFEFDEDSLNIAAKASIIASEVLKKAALDIQIASGIEDTNKYDRNVLDAMYDLRAIADDLDASGHDSLMKKASALDEILITMASGVEAQEQMKIKFEKKIAEIQNRAKKKKVATEKNIKEANKELRPLEAALSTRTCPNHPGAQMARLRDDIWYCMSYSEQIDYKNGYTTAKGNKVPGTDVNNQTDYANNLQINTMFQDNK